MLLRRYSKIIILAILGILTLILPLAVHAAEADSPYAVCDNLPTLREVFECRTKLAQGSNTDAGIDEEPFFTQPEFLNPKNFSFLSWIALAVNIVVIFVAIYWILLVIKGAFTVVTSLGNAEKIAEGSQQIRSVMISIIALFVFLFVLIIVGNFFGIGSIWEWPQSFSQCENHNNKFYFTVRLENPGEDIVCN